MNEAGKGVITSLMRLKQSEVLAVGLTVKDNRLEFLGVKSDCLGLSEGLDAPRGTQEDVDHTLLNWLLQ